MFRKLFKINHSETKNDAQITGANTQIEEAKTYFLAGVNQLQLGEFTQAEESFLRSLEIIPDRISTLTNLVTTQFKLNKFSAAKTAAEKVLHLDPNNIDVTLTLGLIELEEQKIDAGLAHFHRATELNPNHAQAWSLYGLAQAKKKKYSEALAHMQRAIELDPTLFEPWLFSGMAFAQLGRHEEALVYFQEAEALNTQSAKLWINKAISLHALHSYEESLMCYQKGYSIEPDSDYLLGDYIHAKLLVCDWKGIDDLISMAEVAVANGRKVASPFAFLSISDSPALQQKVCELASQTLKPIQEKIDFGFDSCSFNDNRKIRLGYFSSDFYNHPVSYLTAELFELHDRSQFEVIAFNLSPEIHDDEMQRRLRKTFDQFHDVGQNSDEQIAKISQDLKIDIAIDLGGHTKNSRLQIFANRAAPIQISYLGFPGTTGCTFIDYIVADKYLIPEVAEDFYTEKIIFMPNCFQSNDSHRKISDEKFSKEYFGLPKDAYIFCSFNNDYKVNPSIFKSWCRILKNTPSSVLWLLASTPAAESNLRNEALKNEINPKRLIFSGRLPAAEYLARFQLADLFLDTLPFNAGTTASDALWAGLPVLTQTGQSFAGRMATSILCNIGLDELITTSSDEYENKAINLATHSSLTKALKEKLAANLKTYPLFNAQQFCVDLESAYLHIHKSKSSGSEPNHFRPQ